MQFLCHVYTVHRLCRHFPHVSCITGHLFCPVLWGWATDPRCGEQLCCVPGGEGVSLVMVLPVPPEGTLGYVTCALAANSTKAQKENGLVSGL